MLGCERDDAAGTEAVLCDSDTDADEDEVEDRGEDVDEDSCEWAATDLAEFEAVDGAPVTFSSGMDAEARRPIGCATNIGLVPT